MIARRGPLRAPRRGKLSHVDRIAAIALRRLAFLALVGVVLAGCAQATPGYDEQPAARRCNRNGDIEERKAC